MNDPLLYKLNIFYSTNNAINDTLTIALIGPESDLPLDLLKYPRRGETFKLYGLWHTYDEAVANAREIFGRYLADRVPGSRIEHDNPQARQHLLAVQDQVAAGKTGKVWANVEGERCNIYSGSLAECYAWTAKWSAERFAQPGELGLEVIDDDANVETQAPLGDPLANQEVWSR